MNKKYLYIAIGVFIIAGLFLYFYFKKDTSAREILSDIILAPNKIPEPEILPKLHLDPPLSVRAVYLSSWGASSGRLRNHVINLIDTTELNAVVIDVKDYTGNVSFKVRDPYLASIGSDSNRIRDIDAFIQELHDKNIYVIARIATFQDPYYAKAHPEYAVKRKTNKNEIWKDRKGMVWFDPGADGNWKYIVAIAKESYDRGFDEINFDYIRFPTDGNMSDIYYPYSEGKHKSAVMGEFFAYLNSELRTKGIPISADLFGMTTTNKDDMNIGQVLEIAAPHFDFIAPMVYPSHYPSGWNKFKNPAANPYEVIKLAMKGGYERLEAMGEDPKKLRPWLQDFDLGAKYTPDMVRAQIQATYDSSLTSWMLWDPSNTYTPSALQKSP